MRKALILLLFVACCGVASAQIVMNEVKQHEKVCSASNGFDNLMKYDKGGVAHYYLSLSSENRFDNLYRIHLGTKENALTTLSQLLNNFAHEKSLSCVDDEGENFSALGWNFMGDKYWSIRKKGYAGDAVLRLSVIRKFTKALQE